MGILNVTPDSFSDGGEFVSVDTGVAHASAMVEQGADIIDIGGESTRPGSSRISVEEEIARTRPVIEAISRRFDIPISIDTTKFEVAEAALAAGAEIINDISGLRWDGRLAELAVKSGAGLVLMHSRGDFETMHSLDPVQDIFEEVARDFDRSISAAHAAGVADAQIALDVGIGFGKTFEQNLELIAKLDKLVAEFENFPVVVGASRKSFMGKLLGGTPSNARLAGSLATVVLAVRRGAKILRIHDVRPTVEALSVAIAIEERSSQ
jgi:dihydropteroate synthase